MLKIQFIRLSKLPQLLLEKQSKCYSITRGSHHYSQFSTTTKDDDTKNANSTRHQPASTKMKIMKTNINHQYGTINNDDDDDRERTTSLFEKIKLGLVYSKKARKDAMTTNNNNTATDTTSAETLGKRNPIDTVGNHENNDDQDNDDIIWKNLTMDDFAPIDAFHTRGKKSTMELASLVTKHYRNHHGNSCGIFSQHYILDVGCGLGGTARYLANEYGCHVVGIDLTTEYIQVGNKLTKLLQMNDKVTLMEGNALQLPFNKKNTNANTKNGDSGGDTENNHNDDIPDLFDMVWTEHVQMNIEHKVQFYSELSRVLRHDGYVLFHDVFLGSTTSSINGGIVGGGDHDSEGREEEDCPLHYPVPWAEDETLSYLSTEKEAKKALALAGLEVLEWIDTSEESIAFLERALKRIKPSNSPSQQQPSFGIHLLMGDNATLKLQNHLQNLQEQRTKVVMGVAIKSSTPNAKL